MKRFFAGALSLLALTGLARGESNEVRIAMPYGVGYLPVYVAADKGFIQERAKAAGLGEVKVDIRHMASGPASSDLLLSGDADMAMGGFGPAFVLWDKTRGAQKIKVITPLSGNAIWLLSSDPKIKTIRDFGPNDRIAVSAIKVTGQAIALQMASAKEWGWDQRFKLDANMVSMSNPDGMAMVLGGVSEVRTQAAIPPFSIEMMESGKVHMVLNSDDVMDPKASLSVLYGTSKFHDGNPKLYAATAAALEAAFDFIRDHPHEAAEIYIAREPQKHDLAWIEKMINDRTLLRYGSTPRGFQKYAEFMFAAGTLKSKPDTWKDLCWENMWGKDGS